MSSFAASSASEANVEEINAKTTKVVFTLTSASDVKIEMDFKAACAANIVVIASSSFEEEDQLDIDLSGVSVVTFLKAKAFMEHYAGVDTGAFKSVLGSPKQKVSERPRIGSVKDDQNVQRCIPLKTKFQDVDPFYSDLMDGLEMISDVRKAYSRQVAEKEEIDETAWLSNSPVTSVVELLECCDKLQLKSMRILVIAKIVELTKGNNFLPTMELFKCSEEQKQRQRDVQTSKDKTVGYFHYDEMRAQQEGNLKFAFDPMLRAAASSAASGASTAAADA